MGSKADDARGRSEMELSAGDASKEERRRRVTFLSLIIGLVSGLISGACFLVYDLFEYY